MRGILLYRLGGLLLLFLCVYVLMKLESLWLPIVIGIKVLFLPLALSFLVAYLLHPIVEKLHEKGMKRSWAILLIYLFFFLLFAFGLYKGFPFIIKQLEEISIHLPQISGMYEKWNGHIEARMNGLPHFFHTQVDHFTLAIKEWFGQLIQKGLRFIQNVPNYMVTIGVIPFFVFYLLKDREELVAYFWQVIPKKWRTQTEKVLQEMNESLGKYVKGQLVVCLFLAIAGTILFWLIGLPYPLLLGIFIGMTDIIPYFGPIIGSVPALTFAAGLSLSKVLIVLVIVILLQFIEGNILSPYIVGKSLHIHPLFIIFALLVSGTLWGVTGIFFAVPGLVVMKTLIKQVKITIDTDKSIC